MQLFWGTYAFPVNAAACTSRTRVTSNQSGRPMRIALDFNVRATLFGNGQQSLSDQEALCRAALSIPYQDLILKQDNGADSSMRLLQRASAGGVKITDGPHFTDAQSPEFVSTRTVEFTGTAEYFLPGSTGLMSYYESVSVLGNGGPIRRWRNPVNAGLVRQVVNPRSLIVYTQSGRALGHIAYPVPRMIFPAAYCVNEAYAVVQETPTPMGNAWVDWPVSWNFIFQADRLLNGGPQLPLI